MGWLVLREALSPVQGLAIAAIVAASVGTTLSLGGRKGESAADVMG